MTATGGASTMEAMPFNVGPGELLIVLVIALLLLGPKRLPDAGRALGAGLRNFKSGLFAELPQAGEESPARALEPAAGTDDTSRGRRDEETSGGSAHGSSGRRTA
jgi:sec-independent protein translocase protein TatA